MNRLFGALGATAAWLVAGAMLGASGCGAPARSVGSDPDHDAATGQPGAKTDVPAQTSAPAKNRGSSGKGPPAVPERYRARPLKQLSAEQLDDGWIELFDGQTLFGWQAADASVDWRVEHGAIVAETGGPGLLTTFVPFADFELRCEVRLERGGNSGIFLRTPARPKDPTRDCYEWNLCDTHPTFPTGSVVGRHAVHDVRIEDDRWHVCRIRFEGPALTAWIDDRLVTQFRDDPRAAGFVRRGFIGLQQNRGRVAFRKVFLKPLGMQPLLSGEDLRGWLVVPGSRSRFEMADGTLTVLGGPGYLQSEKSWDDLALQFEARVDGDGLNSGVFFRALPGTAEAPANGYEVQIHNGFLDGDRSRPADAGTGAIFRRTIARWVVPDDHRWFHVTLVAVGDRFGVWVDGFPVTMWQDTRPDDPNPRRGRRLLAGHVILQGHDPITRVRFRRMRLADWGVTAPVPGTEQGDE